MSWAKDVGPDEVRNEQLRYLERRELIYSDHPRLLESWMRSFHKAREYLDPELIELVERDYARRLLGAPFGEDKAIGSLTRRLRESIPRKYR